MLKIPFATGITNAAAGLTGLYGDVTRQSEVVDCSRQTIYDHAHKVQAAVEDAHDGRPTRAQLIEQEDRTSVTRMPNSGTGSLRPSTSHRANSGSSPSPPRRWG